MDTFPQFPQNQLQEPQKLPEQPINIESTRTKSKYFKFVAAFLAIIIVAAGGYFVWSKYFSPQAKLAQQTQENYQK